MDNILKYDLQSLEKQKTALYESGMDDEAFAFWASVVTQHVISWKMPKDEKKAKSIKEIKEGLKFMIAYNTTLKMRSNYLATESSQLRKNYNRECLERKELEKEVIALKNEVKHYENKEV